MTRHYPFIAPIGFCLLFLAGCAAERSQTASVSSVPTPQPGMARIWVLRQPSIEAPLNSGGDPVVSINGASLGQIAPSTFFYHDVQAGTYRLTVQPFGTPTNLVNTVQLSPGMTSYVQVKWIANWRLGSTVGGASFEVLTMNPRDAQAVFKALRFVGHR